jgi:hypothetical protein
MRWMGLGMRPLFGRRLHIATVLIVGATLSGCAVWPGSSLPRANQLSAYAQKNAPEDKCAENVGAALNCARGLSAAFADMETDTGNWDTAYSLTGIALGTLTATYLKSAKDRSQGVEDVAVAAGTLLGIRGVLKPDERRKVAREGRRAVECMIASVEGIQTIQVEQREPEGASPEPQSPSALSAIIYEPFRASVQTRFGLAPTPPSDTNQGATAANPTQLLGQRLLRMVTAADNARSESIAIASIPARADATAKTLAYGLRQVLNNVRSSVSDLSSARADIVKTQTSTVHNLIGDLAKATEQEQKAAEQAKGAAMVASEDPDAVAKANDAAAAANTPGVRRLQNVYERCVAPDM